MSCDGWANAIIGVRGYGGGDVFAIDKDSSIGMSRETRDFETGEMRIGDAAVLELDGLEERAAETLDIRAMTGLATAHRY